MAGKPDVFALLEEMLDSGRTAEEVCRDCPALLPEVRRRWQAFRLVDEAVAAHLFGSLPRVEHLLEQFEQVGVAGHGLVSSGCRGVARRLRGPA